jgi:hypothetical protein
VQNTFLWELFEPCIIWKVGSFVWKMFLIDLSPFCCVFAVEQKHSNRTNRSRKCKRWNDLSESKKAVLFLWRWLPLLDTHLIGSFTLCIPGENHSMKWWNFSGHFMKLFFMKKKSVKCSWNFMKIFTKDFMKVHEIIFSWNRVWQGWHLINTFHFVRTMTCHQ